MKKLTGSIDLANSSNSPMTTNLIATSLNQIGQLLNQMQQNQFAFHQFTFQKNLGSGLTNVAGIYMVYNKRTQKAYVGSSVNLAQRKGEYKRNLTDPNRFKKVNANIITDLQNGQIGDFYFIPLVGFDHNQVIGYTTKLSLELRKQLSIFFDLEIEKAILQALINPNASIGLALYNTKTVGRFQAGNTYGKGPNSGSASKALSISIPSPSGTKEFAWESVSAASNSLKIDRKIIRIKRDRGVFQLISKQDFEAFLGSKIENQGAAQYFEDKLDDLTLITQFIRKK